MNHSAKHVFEKMVDFKTFGKVLLAVGVFFYLGSVLPSVSKSILETYIMLGASTVFLLTAIIFFLLSKVQYNKLLEMEEGLKYINKK